jgi:hypothetical protein
MNGPLDDHLYEVHVIDGDGGPWRHAGNFETLEDARVEAVHLVTETDVRSARVMHVVEYYEKSA